MLATKASNREVLYIKILFDRSDESSKLNGTGDSL